MARNFIRIGAVTKMVGLGRSTIYRKIEEGTFPQPIRPLGPGTKPIAFVESEIEKFVRDRIEQSRSPEAAAQNDDRRKRSLKGVKASMAARAARRAAQDAA